MSARSRTLGVSTAMALLLVACTSWPASPIASPFPSRNPATAAATPVVVQTATSTPAPTADPTVQPSTTPTLEPPTPTLPPPVAMWEGELTLDTYGWEQALGPSTPDDPFFPYPRLDFDVVAGPAPRSYRAIFLQNIYVQIAILPELGGRILRWTDRTTGRQLFYSNPVVKPTRWGYRGWWLATGGMEWAFPTEEHGLNEYRPWAYEFLWNGVRVWDTDDRTGMTVEVAVELEAGTSRVVVTPRVTNPTDEAQSFQLWANAMLTLSGSNAPSPDLVFVMPASEVAVHSTGDGSLPGPRGRMSWPVHGERDFSRYGEWRSYLGVFAPQAAEAGFAGAYDLGADQGIVRVAPAWVQGVKLFCLGDLDSALWTDDGSRYFELWGGLTPSFWDYTWLEPGASVGWTEHWYAVSGMGGYSWANAEGAARLTPLADGVDVAVETVRPVRATVVLLQGGSEAARWAADVGPGRPFRTTWGPGPGPWGLEVLGPQGTTLIKVGD